MYSRTWQVIKDDSKKTFEVCGQTSNTNAFTNSVYAMQRAGMNVSCVTPPVTNQRPSKEMVKIVGYVKEDGLHERLINQFREITMGYVDDSE
jgi:hypothetical protein